MPQKDFYVKKDKLKQYKKLRKEHREIALKKAQKAFYRAVNQLTKLEKSK